MLISKLEQNKNLQIIQTTPVTYKITMLRRLYKIIPTNNISSICIQTKRLVTINTRGSMKDACIPCSSHYQHNCFYDTMDEKKYDKLHDKIDQIFSKEANESNPERIWIERIVASKCTRIQESNQCISFSLISSIHHCFNYFLL